jgi:hypothetical protein
MQKVIDLELKKKVMDRFIGKFIQDGFSFWDEKDGRKLLWCCFRENYNCDKVIIKTIDIPKIEIPTDLPIYVYFDRSEDLFLSTFSDYCKSLLNLEEWEYTDTEIFNESFEWVIAVTHDDLSILFGFEG